jgi:3-dehydroquinate dehydratase II
MTIHIINGPNINLVGNRETSIYRQHSFDSFFETLQEQFKQIKFVHKQTNIEGELVNYIQEAGAQGANAIVLNAAAYTHTSIAIHDALKGVNLPCVEVHISNVYAREEFRKENKLAAACVGSISGLGLQGYLLAVLYLINN